MSIKGSDLTIALFLEVPFPPEMKRYNNANQSEHDNKYRSVYSGVPSEDVAPEPAGVTVAVGVIVKIIRKIEAGVKRG